MSQSVYCFTTSISHGVEKCFPRLWGTGISDAIFLPLDWIPPLQAFILSQTFMQKLLPLHHVPLPFKLLSITLITDEDYSTVKIEKQLPFLAVFMVLQFLVPSLWKLIREKNQI